ncbi:MAG: LysR family transcriptional regulator [Pseudomonadota bacterium]
MDQLKAMEVFVRVVREGGFAPAARALGLSKSSVSRHVSNLEAALGEQLLNRTTRALRLTQAGEEVLDHCEAIVLRTEQMMQERDAASIRPRGRLRITMPHFLAAILMRDVVAQFVLTHPDVQLEIFIADRLLNLVEEGVDLALRVGRQPDSSLITRKFIDLRLGVIGAPTYFKKNGTPMGPDDLSRHNCIVDTAAPYRDRWPMRADDGSVVGYKVEGNISVNGGSPARDLVLGGAGIAYLPEYLFVDDVLAGRLVTVLNEYSIDAGGIYIVSPQSRKRSPAIRALTSLLVQHAKPLSQYREARNLLMEDNMVPLNGEGQD